MRSKTLVNVLAVLGLVFGVSLSTPAVASAQVRRGGGPVVVGRAVPRGVAVAPRFIRPAVGGVPYRSFYYRPGLSLGFGFGYPYYYGAYYPYAYGPAYGYPSGYLTAAAYGGVRIEMHDRNAQVFVDGYYAGIVDNFDGAFQHLDLAAGPHHIEVRADGLAPVAFDVNVQPGQTITYRADVAPPQAPGRQ